MRSRPAILVVGLVLAQSASALECTPWTGERTPRLLVRGHGDETTLRFRGRLSVPAGQTIADASLTITAGTLGSAHLDDVDGTLTVKSRRRGRAARVRASAQLRSGAALLDALPAMVVLSAPGYCAMALFEAARCRGGRVRRRCRATKQVAAHTLATLAGTYDGTYVVGSGTTPALAAVVDADGARGRLELRRSPYEFTSLDLTLRPDGRLAIEGVCAPADYLVPASGLLAVLPDARGIRLEGHLDCDGTGTLTLVKPNAPLPSALSGTYGLALGGSTRVTLDLVVDASGTAASAPSVDRDLGDQPVATVEAGTGLVGPGGLVWLTAPYGPVGGERAVWLALFGRLVLFDGAAPPGGAFYVGQQPLVERAGAWTLE